MNGQKLGKNDSQACQLGFEETLLYKQPKMLALDGPNNVDVQRFLQITPISNATSISAVEA
jgi:hypothetical protein